MAFSLAEFKKVRARRRVIGIVCFWGGLLFLMADVTTSFPTPVRGQLALWWLVIVAIGAWAWISSKRLPLEETIEISREPKYFGELRVTELTGELNISLDTSEEILMALVKKGYAHVESRGEVRVWVFPEVRQAGPMVRRVHSNKND